MIHRDMAEGGGGRKYWFGFLQPSRETGADAEGESHCSTWVGDVAKFSV